MALSTLALPANIPQGHDPTTAFLFPFQWNMGIIDADDAWNAGFSGSPGVRVAIVDTGLGRGAFVVSAAGNVAANLDRAGNIVVVPCEFGAGGCVSATGPTDLLASYSNFGSSAIDLVAPGGDFVVTGDVLTSTVLAPCSSLSLAIPACQANGVYLFLEGTSMATAHVAGAAALRDAQHSGGLNGAQLRTRLQQPTDDLGKPGADPFYGKGRLNVFNALVP